LKVDRVKNKTVITRQIMKKFKNRVNFTDEFFKYLNTSDQITQNRRYKLIFQISPDGRQGNNNFNNSFYEVKIFDFHTGSWENINMIKTHRIKKKIGGTGRIYRLFKNILVQKKIFYTGQYSKKISFVNEFNIYTKKSRPILAVNKPETLLKEDFHLGIDKHNLVLVSTKSGEGKKNYLIFRTSTKKVLRRIEVKEKKSLNNFIKNC